jgi:DNA-directed RNA polymerase specialized sigma24 family protein
MHDIYKREICEQIHITGLAVDRLRSEDERAGKAILLRYVFDADGADIAAVLGVHESTVSRILAQAHERLYEIIEALLTSPP